MFHSFAIDPYATIAACVILIAAAALWWWTKHHHQEPYIKFSMTKYLEAGTKTARTRWASLPKFLLFLGLVFLLLAFIDPHYYVKKPETPSYDKPPPTEGIAIYILADESGSMRETVVAENAQGEQVQISKIDLLKQVTKEFIQGNPAMHLPGHQNDLIGLITFARVPHILAPLTLDHKLVLQDLQNLQVVTDFQDNGTAIGYALFKAVNLIAATRHFAQTVQGKIKPAYNIEKAVIVLVTDGLQYPNPLDKGNPLRTMGLEEAAQYAKDNDVKIYLVNIDPGISAPDLAPQRHQMERITTLTGGKFYMITESGSLNKIYADIDKIEKGTIQEEEIAMPEATNKEKLLKHYQRVSLFPYLIVGGLLLLAMGVILGTTKLKQVP